MPLVKVMAVQKFVKYDGSNGAELRSLLTPFVPASSPFAEANGQMTIDTGALAGVITIPVGSWINPSTFQVLSDSDFNDQYERVGGQA